MDFINIINLSPDQDALSTNPNFTPAMIRRSREERILSICKQSKEHNFCCRFWEGVIDKRGGWAGINLSFSKIVEWAKQQKFSRVIIGEDDLLFSAPGAWAYYLEQMPEDFDIWSGGVYSAEIKDGRIMNGWSGNTLITIHSNFYDEFLKMANDALLKRDHLDRYFGNFCFEKNYRVVEPFVVYQLEGYSDNHRRMTAHAGYLEKIKSKLFAG